MDIRKWIEQSDDLRRKHAYYLGLGFSEMAAEVLSAVTSGTLEASFLVSQFGSGRVIESLYAWLCSREEEMPEQAISAFYREKHPRPVSDEPLTLLQQFGRMLLRPSDSSGSFSDSEMPFPDFGDENQIYGGGPSPGFSRSAAGFSWREEPETLPADAYDPIEEKNAKSPLAEPTSTFRMTAGSASMGAALNRMRCCRKGVMDQARMEEVLNYFDYDMPAPADAGFGITTELLEKQGNKKLLFIGAQAAGAKKDHQNIVLLLDVSDNIPGSLEVMQETAAAVFSRLRPGDHVGLVTCRWEDHTVLENYEITDSRSKEDLMDIFLGIGPSGETTGAHCIEAAYEIAEKLFRPGWNNQVILITDGDLNLGISDRNELKRLIEEKKKSRLFLSVIGICLRNFKDDRLEDLSKYGNGTYCVVNSLEDVDESVNRHFIALTNIVAKDVKAQVEFNPRFVKSYRLLGFENRQLNHGDFRNDALIPEPYGSGGHSIALYELEMNDGETPEQVSDLKYQKRILIDSDELATVSVRYKEPLGDSSFLIEEVVYNISRSTQNTELAYFLYCICAKLRGSDKLDAYDEQFLDRMITDGAYRNFSEPNREKLELLVEAWKQTRIDPERVFLDSLLQDRDRRL